ncbi:FecR family protein [Mucilaginibacter oryzae]|uniref:FecR family protein n=1 Tax=Mucilaginibacter oryzae TaxID=468058 RepID=A0A316H960_9SPHI|nr:FecR domain-containing protein [Mucilaginibacter oryzae]PWK77046.1 FecR family protein [Mucilaginibacter oryzae]
MARKYDAKQLINKLRTGQLGADEKSILESWYIVWGGDKEIDLDEDDLVKTLEQVESELPQLVRKNKKLTYWPRYVAAAATIILAISIFLFLFNRPQKANQQFATHITPITPGKNGARLILSNGRTIVLNAADKGPLAADGGSTVSKADEGQLKYVENDKHGNANTSNTLITSRGEQYRLLLPDGTKVYLNAGSSLKYPTSFSGAEKRAVELKGEGYFEVAKDAHHPFIVSSAGQEVEVLGTHFDISSYPDDAKALTTLLEGSVRINDKLLKPGQQAVVTAHQLKIFDTDAQSAIAWTKGRFHFNGENITGIMRCISRWYNIEVTFKGDMRGKDFAGGFSRYDDVSTILDLLASTNHLHYTIEGRRVTIMN